MAEARFLTHWSRSLLPHFSGQAAAASEKRKKHEWLLAIGSLRDSGTAGDRTGDLYIAVQCHTGRTATVPKLPYWCTTLTWYDSVCVKFRGVGGNFCLRSPRHIQCIFTTNQARKHSSRIPTPEGNEFWHILPCSASTVRDRKRSLITLNKNSTRAFQRAIQQRSTPPLTSSKWGSKCLDLSSFGWLR